MLDASDKGQEGGIYLYLRRVFNSLRSDLFSRLRLVKAIKLFIIIIIIIMTLFKEEAQLA